MTPIALKSDVPPRSAADDEEYRRNYDAFEYVHALYALDHGWTGQGVLVGVADDGVVANAELAGQISSLSRDFGQTTTGGATSNRNVIGDSYSDHGTLVAGVIAARNDGRNDGQDIQGIAPGAKIVALRVSDTNTTTREETLGRTLPAALDYAASIGVKIVNLSLAKVDAAVPSPAWARMVERYTAAGGLVVNSAGNDGEANAKGYLDLTPANRDGWLFVVGLETTDAGLALANYSNQCGAAAMDRCVAAMGTQATMDVDGALVWFSGTSAAAPQVSGIAALILGKWPQLSGIQAGQVIVNTARDIGDAGVDAVYGHGLVDVEAALAPVNPVLSNGVAQTALAGSVMVIPDVIAVAGAGAQIRQMLSNVTVLDAYGRDYSGSIAGLVAEPERNRTSFARRFEAGANAGTTAVAGEGMAARLGYASWRTSGTPAGMRSRITWGEASALWGGTRLTAGYSTADGVLDEAMGLVPTADVALAYAPGADLSVSAERHVGAGGAVSLTAFGGSSRSGSARGGALGWKIGATKLKAGVIEERGSVFGTPVGSGALRFGDGARTAFVELSQGWRAGAWSIEGYGSLGATRLNLGSDTLLTDASTVWTGRAAVSASRAAMGGRLRLGMALPLAAFSGAGTISYGSGYDLATRSLVLSRQRVGFSGRFDPVLSLGFERGSPRSSLRLAAAADTDGGDLQALASWRLRWR